MSIINVILSGGVGSRLWPLSRQSRPKQYIPLFGGLTLFQMCAQRNQTITDSIIVVGSRNNYTLTDQNLADLQIDVYQHIIEATPRNTAASIAFAAFQAQADDILLITPSDHVIEGHEAYSGAVKQAVQLAQQNYIVTFGGIPTRAETGYGYIEKDANNQVLSFKEKPDAATAAAYVAAQNYLWNSGMFCIKASVYLEELLQHGTEVYHTSKTAYEAMDSQGFLPEAASMQIPNISVDYAVMEKSKRIKVVPFSFQWNDLGSFEAIWDYMIQTGEHQLNNLVLGSQKHVEFLGVDDIIYVETADAVLITHKSNTQEVKNIYERLEKEHPHLLK